MKFLKSIWNIAGLATPSLSAMKFTRDGAKNAQYALSSGLYPGYRHPSGLIPCSKQNNSQQALDIRVPACPTKIVTTSLNVSIESHILLHVKFLLHIHDINFRQRRASRAYYFSALFSHVKLFGGTF